MAGSGGFYGTGSSALAAGNNQSMSAANLQSRSRMNPMLVNTNQLNTQSIQSRPQIKTEVLDQSEKMNFQSSQLTQEQLLRQQHSMQQHQVQPNSQFVQNQYHLNQQQQNPQHQQSMLRSNSFKQSQLVSSHSMQLSEQGALPHTELISSQATDRLTFQISGVNTNKEVLMIMSKEGRCFVIYLTQNFHASGSHDSQQLLLPNPQLDDGSNDINYGLKGPQTDQMLQPQWQSQTIEKASVTTNPPLEKQMQEDFCQRTMTQDGGQQPFSSDWRLSRCMVTSTDPSLPKLSVGGFEQMQELIKHFQNCQRKDCSYRGCSKSTSRMTTGCVAVRVCHALGEATASGAIIGRGHNSMETQLISQNSGTTVSSSSSNQVQL